MWYYNKSGTQKGPYEEPLIVEAIAAGRLPPDALVWKAGMPEWLPLHQTELARHLPSQSSHPAFPPQPPAILPPPPPPPPPASHLPRLWNPNTAGILSVLISGPIFGPIIHGLNWRTLGKKRDAKISFIWAIGILLSLWTVFFLEQLLAIEKSKILVVCLVSLLLWHFIHGRKQISFTKNLPGGYEKRSIILPSILGMIATVMVLLLPAIIILSLFSNIEPHTLINSDHRSSSANTSDHRAKEAAKDLVLKNLKSPSTAKFPEIRVIYKEPPWYQLFVFVDAQNSFGSYIRDSYVCTIRLDEDGYYHRPGPGIQRLDESQIEKAGFDIFKVIRESSHWPGSSNPESKTIPTTSPEDASVSPPTAEDPSTEPEKPASPPAVEIPPTKPAEPIVEKKVVSAKSLETEKATSSQKTEIQIKLAETKSELAALETRIESERKRWTESIDTINRLTNNKRTPVKEGSPAYHQCMTASRVIQEVEQKAPELKSEKARLEALIKELTPSE